MHFHNKIRIDYKHKLGMNFYIFVKTISIYVKPLGEKLINLVAYFRTFSRTS